MGLSIDTGDGGRKPVDAELNLVPFIDLLVCCICFLLITAVWAQMSQVPVSHGRSTGARAGEVRERPLTLLVDSDGYTLADGSLRMAIPRQGAHYDDAALRQQLRRYRRLRGTPALTVAVADGVDYRRLVQTIDVVRAARFTTVRLTDGQLAI